MAADTHSVASETAKDFVIDSVVFDRPWIWLAAGWRDLCAKPGISLAYGAVFAVISLIVAYGLTQFGWQSVVIAMAGGFLILGPLLAVGLYELSRRRSAGEPVEFGQILHPEMKSPGQLLFMGFVLLFLFSAWLRIAFLLFALFFGSHSLPPIENFISELLFTTHGLSLLIVGTIVGGALALVAYMISVISIPLLMTHRVDALTAMSLSVETVLKNLNPMLLWAALIAGFMALGLVTGFIGLAVAFPLIGHATWHAYEDLIHNKPVGEVSGAEAEKA
ncbi:MAG: DUF2189 domain-containing protein [Alphaproteobacteria bacterium]|nr:DUF2189 domain-containing protein [Alphaproteobacteria bacterium]